MVCRRASNAPRSIPALSFLVIFNSWVRLVSQLSMPSTPGSALNSAHRARNRSQRSDQMAEICIAKSFWSRITLASDVCFSFCCAANRTAASLDHSDTTISRAPAENVRTRTSALPSDLSGFWIDVASPPIRCTLFGAKSAIDSRGRGGPDVQVLVLLLEGEPPHFLILSVVKGSYQFRHPAPVHGLARSD